MKPKDPSNLATTKLKFIRGSGGWARRLRPVILSSSMEIKKGGLRMSLASFISFLGVFIALVLLSLFIIAGIGIWADQAPGTQPEYVRLMMLVVSFAAMLTATAGFIVYSFEEALRGAIRQLELRIGD
jgi:hypothetical protein